MHRLIFALIAFLTLSQQAIACRGPFSDLYSIHVSKRHQVYLGKVVSLRQAIANAGTPYENKVTLVRFEVIRAWQPNPPTEVSVADVKSNTSDPKLCVRAVLPQVGEDWLVVAAQYGDTLYQVGLMGLDVTDSKSKAEAIQTIKKFRPRSFQPRGH